MTSVTETLQTGDEPKKQTPTKETPDDKPQQDGEQTKDAVDEKSKDNDGKSSSPSKLKSLLPAKSPVHKEDYEQDVVYLYQFNRCPTIPSVSPYCLKVETWLRLAGIKYENVDHKMRFKSKKGQLPFVELNGKEIADSEIIIRDLSQHFDKNLDDGLTADQRIISHALVSMLNNHTSWVVRWWRYNNPGEFLDAAQMDVKRALNSKLPKGLLTVLFKIGFKHSVQEAVGHGIGHHSTEEIYDLGKGDLKALSESLADHEFFFGKEPHVLDCVAFAHLSQFIYVPFGGMKEWIEQEASNLVGFVNRMKERLWPDWEQACTTLDLNTHIPKKESEVKAAEEEAAAAAAKKEAAAKAKEEAKKQKEEKKRLREEQKKEKLEKKKKEKEEKERKKQEEKEKAEKEKAEKEAAEKAEKEKAASEAAAKQEEEAKKTDEETKKDETKTTEASGEDKTTPATETKEEKKD